MKLAKEQPIYTGSKFFGQKVLLQSSGDKDIDAALKSVFHDHYCRTSPLEMSREDIQILLKWSKSETKKPVKRQGQMALFGKE